jgi:predicted ATPase/signal transduction histidine kinase
MTALPTHVVETLWEDEEFVLCRRVADDVSLLVSAPLSAEPTVQTLKRLDHAYALRDELDSAWAARPVALEGRDGRPTLLIEDPGGEVLARTVGEPWELTPFLHVAVGLAVSVGRLHARNLIHGDLKPSNILVNLHTRQLWLTGFGIASRLLRERRAPQPPETIAGTLAYMAPEQTGRMNRSIDARSDLYSLGVTLYQMLTGSLPFTASDPMEWVHCHIARKPVPPNERLEAIPLPLSQIIMKLLEKTAEQRYQTATGVESDLRRCLSELELHGRIAPFALGQHDKPDRLLIPEKLYGRAREVEILLSCFDRIVTSGTPELVLVSGYSGVGKSAVVHELHKALVPPRGLFASGKFDQYKRDIPYSTLAQAFQTLIRGFLAKSEAALAPWRDALREALGLNGRLMTELIPELTLIIGEQPNVPELPNPEARVRFQIVLRRFIGVFARAEHPLALFLDDLQWLDTATLDLMEDLLNHSDLTHLMLIGAYRDNEVGSTHPLTRRLQAMREAGASVQEIVLAPLTRQDLEQLIADSLRCEPAQAGPLAALVHEKTSGNPFFSGQFLAALFDEGILAFDHLEGRWSWDLNRIYSKGYTDNVVDLMVSKLTRLEPETQNALKQLACLSSNAELATLRVVYQDSVEHMQAALADAGAVGLILRSNESYRFLHDRVQEAAYSLIPEDVRADTHLRIGTALASNTPPDKLGDRIFEIVNQLNRSAHLMTSAPERERTAGLNLMAARRAKVATAYTSAIAYLHAGRALVNDEPERYDHALVFSLECLLAECEMLTAETAAAEQRLTMLAGQAKGVQEIGLVTRLRLTLQQALNRSDRAVDVFLEFWRGRGEDWTAHPSHEEAVREYDRIWKLIGDRQVGDLIQLSPMTDPDALEVHEVLSEIVTPSMFFDPEFFLRVACRMVSHNLEYGNSEGACYAYSTLAVLTGPRLGHYEVGFKLAQLGYELAEQPGRPHRFQARVSLIFGGLVTPWSRHIRFGREFVRRAHETANRLGDLTFVGYCLTTINTNMLAAGDPLADAQREVEAGLQFVTKIRFGIIVDCIVPQLALIRNLRGLNATFGSFTEENFDEPQYERRLASDPVLALPECWYWLRKMQARFFAGQYAVALEASLKTERLLWTSSSFFEVAEYHFYTALTRAACLDSATGDSRQQHREALLAHLNQLEVWAQHCPENFENRAALVGAEIARVEAREIDAERLYEAAIRSARGNEFVHHEALAYELAACFYLARGFVDIGALYMRKARHCYLRWGADGKVRQLDQLYPDFKEREPALGPTSTIGALVAQLDLSTVIKVLQAVSGEMVSEKLIDSLMRTAIEHAGAGRGLLVDPQGDELHVEAEATSGDGEVSVRLTDADLAPVDVPKSIVHFVARTHETLVIGDASADSSWFTDAYVRAHRARSILCLPLLNRAKLIGVLYLENNLTPHVFAPARIAVLRLLASQAAISLENARLYRDAQQMDTYLKTAEALSHTGSFGLRPATGDVIWSDETYQIMECDRAATTPTLELVLQRTHPDDIALVQQNVDRAASGVTSIDFEHRLLMPDGSTKWVHVLAHGVRDEAGSLEYVGAIMDITARRQAEEALLKLQSELAHASRVMTMGELAASIAHEVNQPLAAIAATSQASLRWLAQPTPNLEKLKKLTQDVASDAMRASEIVTRIRAMAAGRGAEPAVLSLDDVIREALLFLRYETEARGVTVTHVPAKAPPLVFGDRTQFQQVIVNLTINAVQAMVQAGTEQPAINITTVSNDPERLGCSVEDNGPGIEPQNIARLFDSFFTTKDNGMGMGLRICRSVIEAHRGRIGADNESSMGGARFYFTLPVAGAG